MGPRPIRPARPSEPGCPGPLVWYPCDRGGVLHCATCGHITVTGNFHEPRHRGVPILMEGFAF